MPVVDASVWVSICHQGDRSHRRCREWLAATLVAGEELMAPNVLPAEVAAAIRRLTGDAVLAAEAAGGLVDLELVRLAPLSAERSRAASQLAAQTGVRGADALYLALAVEHGEALVTLDRQQLERGGSVAEVVRP